MAKRASTNSLNSRRAKPATSSPPTTTTTTTTTVSEVASNKNNTLVGGGCTNSTTTSASSSIVESLQMLRSFVGDDSGFTESDLSTCLRQSGYVVEVAAERLMTGQYQPPKKKNGDDHNINNKRPKTNHHNNHDNLNPHRSGTMKTTPQQQLSSRFATTTQRTSYDNVPPLSTTEAATGADYCSGTEKTPSHISRRNHDNDNNNSLSSSARTVTPKSTPGVTKPHQRSSTKAATTSAAKEDAPSPSGWLLCQRWVSDGVNLQRNGSCNYQERFYIQDSVASASTPTNAVPSEAGQQQQQQQRPGVVNHSSLRFRSSSNRIQGHFPRYLATILSPLLRSNLIRLDIAALMEERNLNIGAQIAFSISVWIVDPLVFFAVFDRQSGGGDGSTTATNSEAFGDEGKSPSSSTYSKQFFATTAPTRKSSNNSNKNRKIQRGGDDIVTISNAAFSFLQWAHYGPDLDQYDNWTSKGNRNEGERDDNNNNNDDDDDDQNRRSDQHYDDSGITVNDDDTLVEDDMDSAAAVERAMHDYASEEEGAIPDWAEKVFDSTCGQKQSSMAVDRGEEVPQYSEMEAPPSFKVQLRPYQRQALYWMTQRETMPPTDTIGNVAPEWRVWRKEQMALLKEISTATTGNDSSVRVELRSSRTCTKISCDCGPVEVNTEQVRAPSISAVLLGREKMVGSVDFVTNVEEDDDITLSHPLWERRFLCNADQTEAVSFFVQPFLRKATASTPSPPKFCSGGILADSMGLGKTVMLLALIESSRQYDEVNHRTDGKREVFLSDTTNKGQHNNCTLIVTPLSLLLQWQEEIETKTTLSHYVHYGELKSSKSGPSFTEVDIVLTTYGSLQAELQSYLKDKDKDKGKSVSGSSPLLSLAWKRVILDEAHIIKNHTTLAAKACSLLQAERRWCVSGTIIQNSLEDVYSLLRFLRHEPWCEHGFWKASITKASDLTVALDRVRRILSPIMLRRTKETHVNGKPILSLPAIDCRTVKLEFTPAERQFYDALFRKSIDIFNGYIQAGTASSSWIKIFSLLHRLRQTCCHVALTIKGHLDDEAWTSMISQASTSSTGVLKGCRTITENEGDVEAVKEEINQEFLKDLLHKFKSVHADGCHVACDGKDENDLNEGNYATRVARKLNDAIQTNSFELKEECSICLENLVIENSVITPCLHLFCQTCLLDVLKDKISGKHSGHCPVCSEEIDSRKILRVERSNEGRLHTNYLCQKSTPEAPLDHDDGAARATLQTATNGGSSSSKLDAIFKELECIWNEKPRSKVVVFSQFMGMLDMLAQRFVSASMPYERLDGKLSLKERMGVLRRFGSESHPMLDDSSSRSSVGSVLLISMKAGGVGLNLVAASTVFIVDPWWNAAVEDQCVDRIHRIGQTASTIHVRKFYIANSIEERILELQKRKKRMASSALCDRQDTEAGTNGSRPSLEELQILFNYDN